MKEFREALHDKIEKVKLGLKEACGDGIVISTNMRVGMSPTPTMRKEDSSFSKLISIFD